MVDSLKIRVGIRDMDEIAKVVQKFAHFQTRLHALTLALPHIAARVLVFSQVLVSVVMSVAVIRVVAA